MARITLRSYKQEIERQIESSRIDESIAHCRHILQVYPRYIDAYRLLGKSYLEAQRYGDASDILQRVLSSIPEDFVSHVGMSIIREDEGNLDESIWHMERAFEMQPSNSTIQDELRRLYGKRDGVEPPKIRLSRGALARMYIRGDLLQEAITELRAAITEDANRLDLRVLLANALSRFGQRVEAAETASQVLRKLPNSLDANRIMYELLAGTERNEEAQGYRKIVCALDPYYSFVTPANPSSDQVPDQSVTLERLEWKAGQPIPGTSDQPAWAASLGIHLGATEKKETLPGWLDTTEEKLPDQSEIPEDQSFKEPFEPAYPTEPELSGPDFLSEIKGEPTSSEEEIPDWMKEAGWSPKAEETLETDLSEIPEPQGEPSESDMMPEPELANAEIPEWLRSIAPEQSEGDIESKESPPKEAEETAAWMEGIITRAESEPEAAQPAEMEHPSPGGGIGGEAEPVEIPDWLTVTDDQAIGSKPESPAEPQVPGIIEELPDWMVEHKDETPEPPAVIPAPADQPEATGEALPDWLFEEETTTTPETELPPWLMGSDEETGSISQPEPTLDAATTEKLPEWLFSEETPVPSEIEKQEDIIPQIMDQAVQVELSTNAEPPQQVTPDSEIPEWLFEGEPAETEQTEIAAQAPSSPVESVEEQTAQPEEEISVQPQPTLKLPSWLLEPTEESSMPEGMISETKKTGPVDETEDIHKSRKESTIPAWLFEDEEEIITSESQPAIQEAETQATESSVPSWLDRLEESPVSEEDTKPSRISQSQGLQISEEEQPISVTPEETPVVPEIPEMEEMEEAEPSSQPESVPQGELLDDEAAFAWLESLAVKQGSEEALMLEPEERNEAPPSWIQEVIEETSQTMAEEPDEIEFEPVGEVIEETSQEKFEIVEPLSEEEIQAEFSQQIEMVSEAEEISPQSPEDLETVSTLEGARDRQSLTSDSTESAEEGHGLVPEWLLEEELEVSPDQSLEAVDTTAAEGVVEPAQSLEPPTEAPSVSEPILEEMETLEPGLESEEQLPELPDWLAEPIAEPTEELEWTPPTVRPFPPVDLNKASLVELERLPGVGFIKAQNILNFRESNGPFGSIDELSNISDFTPEDLEELKDLLFIERSEERVPIVEEDFEPRPFEEEAPEGLLFARQAIIRKEIDQAIQSYHSLIESGQSLPMVIKDLKDTAEHFPQNYMVWQTLGDAYLRADQVHDALHAFVEAEKLLQ